VRPEEHKLNAFVTVLEFLKTLSKVAADIGKDKAWEATLQLGLQWISAYV
jgi:hypothetical protein